MADPWKVARDDKLGLIYWLMIVIVNMNDQMHQMLCTCNLGQMG